MAKRQCIPLVLTEKEASRFWAKVDRSGGPDSCWEFQGCRDRKGYGHFAIKQKPRGAHRIAWTLVNGPIPEGMHALHRCDNPPCCNPAHLFAGTQLDNTADMMAKGRARMIGRPANPNQPPKPGHCKGEQHYSAKVTTDAVIDIRTRFLLGESQSALARHFEISQSMVFKIVHRKSWKHVADEDVAA